MRTFGGIGTHDDEYVSEDYGDGPNPYQDEYSPYEEGWDGTVGHQSPRTVDRRSPASPTGYESEPVRITRGINELDNEWIREEYGDKTNKWGYENVDGTNYNKNRDGSADLFGPGFMKHYSAPDSDVDARDASPEYPVPNQSAPATGREDIWQPEPVNSTENRTKARHKSQPTANRRAPRPPSFSPSPSPPPPPSTSQSLPTGQGSKGKHKSKTNRTTKSRNQESAEDRHMF